MPAGCRGAVAGAIVSLVLPVMVPGLARGQSGFPPGFAAEPVGTGWDAPTGMVFADQDHLFVVEKRGTVWLVEDGVKGSAPLLDLSQEALNNGDRGLLGIQVDPGFAANGYLYLLEVVDPNGDYGDGEQESFARLVRYTVTHDDQGQHVIDPQSRHVVIGDSWDVGIPSCHWSHSIGTIRFLSDGSLVCSAGDGAHYDLTDAGGWDPGCFGSGRFSPDQDVGAFRSVYDWSLAGKIIRVDPSTGLGLPDNPYYTGDPTAIRSKIWAMGLRNPFRFTVRPGTDDLYISDVGWNTWEEVDLAHGGENFGWPCYEGPFSQGSYQAADPESFCPAVVHTPPLLAWQHSSSDYAGFAGNCASGLAFYTGSEYPPAYHNALFFTDYGRSWLKVAQFDQNGNVTQVLPFSDTMHGPVAAEVEPVSGNLYFISIGNNRVWRLHYVLGNQAPVAILDADQTYGGLPLTVQFSAAQSYDPEAEGLTYHWDLGDGTTADTETVEKTYTQAVNATVVLTVTDARGKDAQASVLVSPGNTPPSITIATPSDGDFYHTGDLISLTATAADAEDDQSGTPLNAVWDVNLIHDHHVHPKFYELPGLVSSFVAESHGSGTYLELVLSVTDSRQLTTTQTLHLYDADAVPKAHIVSLSHEGPRAGLPVMATGHAEYAGKGTLDLTWDWGDGSPLEYYPGVTHQQDTTPVHAYQAVGHYTLSLTAADDGQSTIATLPIDVRALQPAVAIFEPLVVERYVDGPSQEELATGLSAWLASFGREVRVFTFSEQDALRQWMQDYANDGVQDVLVLMDVAPATIYQGEDEGSLAEQWIEQGNGIVWTGAQAFAEYLFANGTSSTDGAGGSGLDDLLDPAVPGVSGGLGPMIRRKDAAELPSYRARWAWSAMRYHQLGTGWHVDRLYGSDDNDSDAIVIRNPAAGFFAWFYGTYRADVPREPVIREFLAGYVFGRRQIPKGPERMKR
ncbi:MAG: PQQ-dependent sugar dehydrogenase [Planctomycetota bacterium]